MLSLRGIWKRVAGCVHRRSIALLAVTLMAGCTSFNGPWEPATCTVGTQGETWPSIVGPDLILVFDSPLPTNGSDTAERSGSVLSGYTSTPIDEACRPLGTSDEIVSDTKGGYWTGEGGNVRFTYSDYSFESTDGVITILNGHLNVVTTGVSMTRPGTGGRTEPLEDLAVDFIFVDERYACCWE